jgi:HprK-related kinase B
LLELEEIMGRYRPRAEVRLRLLDVPFTIKANSEELILRLKDYFSLWVEKDGGDEGHTIYAFEGQGVIDQDKLIDFPRHGEKLTKEAYYDTPDGRVALKKRTGLVIYLKGRERYVVGELLGNLNQVINLINEVYMEDFMDRGYILLHASGVVGSDEGGVIISSPSGIGKSTMALALLEKGFRFLSNDRVLIKEEKDTVDMVGVPKKPRVNPGTILALPSLHHLLSPEELELYSSLSKEELWYLEHKFDVDVDSIYGPGTFVLRGRLEAVYLLSWKQEEQGLKVKLLSPEEGLSSLRPQVLSSNLYRKQTKGSQEVESELTSLSRWMRMYHVEGGVNIEELSQVIIQNQVSSKEKEV